jgi:hypothetical protein
MKAPAPTPVNGRSLAMLRPVRQASMRPRAETSSPYAVASCVRRDHGLFGDTKTSAAAKQVAPRMSGARLTERRPQKTTTATVANMPPRDCVK